MTTQWRNYSGNLRKIFQHHWSNNLRKNLNKLHCTTGYWLPHSLFKFFLKLFDQWCWRFSEDYLNNFSNKLSCQIFDCCPRNFLIQEERIGNVVSTSHWIWPVDWLDSLHEMRFNPREVRLCPHEHPAGTSKNCDKCDSIKKFWF